jgi:hypothetical protein
LLRVALFPKMWSVLEKVTWTAERMCTVLLQGEIFCRNQLGLFDLWCHLSLHFLCWFFCLDDLPFGDRGVLKSPTTTVLESIGALKSFSVCLMKLGTLLLGAYGLIIVVSFWRIAPFTSMKWLSLTHLNNVSLKSILYYYSHLFSGAVSLIYLILAFNPKPVFISVNRWVFYKQQIVWSSFTIQFVKQCLLIEELSPLVLGVNIDRYVSFLPCSCFCCLRIWLCAAESMPLYDYLSSLLYINNFGPLMVLFAFIFCVQNSLENFL